MNRFSIKDIEVLTGVKQHTLRIWEQRYNLPQPKRTATNIRYYDCGDLKLLLNVSMLNRYGIKISKITCMSEPEIEQMVLSYTEKDEHDVVIMESLINCMFKIDEVGFEKILTKHILQHGLEKTMLHVVFPFMKRIGVLWLSGSINPAYEHFITNLIRQKLFVAIDGQSHQVLPDSKKFVLFLPSGEPHELGLLFANYLIRKGGNHSLYLGQNLPVTDLSGINHVYKADVVVSVLTTSLKLKSIQEFIKGLAEKFPQAKIVLSGSQLLNRGLIIPRNVLVIEDFDRFIYFLDRLE
jgi:MerR family transcriptional regulator, light-induced transcriptional regulator